jgi:sugar phosphate isomerase/epimerase
VALPQPAAILSAANRRANFVMFKNLSTNGLGISGVESEINELALTYKFAGIDPDFMELYHRAEEKGVPYARRLIDSGRLKLGTFPLPIDWHDDAKFSKEKDKLAKYAARAAELGCNRATISVAPACDQRPYHENFEYHRRRIGEIGAILGQHQVQLGVEFNAMADARQGRAFEFIRKFDELAKLVMGCGVDNVGVVIDVLHWHIGGGTLEDFKPLSARQVVSVVLCDVPDDVAAGKLTDKNRLLPSESGVIDSVAIARWLQSIGYDGPVTARPDRSRFPKTGRMQIVRMVAESLDHVWTEIGLPSVRPALMAVAG